MAYIEKTINLILDTKDAGYLGETRRFSITGSEGAIFSLEVYDDSNNYYDFNTRKWSSTKSKLNRVKLGSTIYNNDILFLSNSSALKTYYIDLYSETVGDIKTNHTSYSEFRNLDNTINLNKSTGSNSNLLRKIIYQDVAKSLYLACIAPSGVDASTDTTSVETDASNRFVVTGRVTDTGVVKIGDKITASGISAASHVLVTKINPDNDNANEFEVNAAVSLGDGGTVTFTPAFNGTTPLPGSTSGQETLSVSSGGQLKTSFSITLTAQTGRTLSVNRVPNINDLCAFTTVTFGAAALAIDDEDVSSSTYYRWPVTNIAGLANGMHLDPARTGTGVNTTTPAVISAYNTTETVYEYQQEDYSVNINSKKIPKVSVDGVDPQGALVTAIDRNNFITAQTGNITFNVQQADALKSDSSVRIFGYGNESIKSLTNGLDVVISNVKVTPTQVSTTTTAAVANSTTIPVTEAGNISTASSIRGAGIAPDVVNPTVTYKSAASGAANLTASAAQTLQKGQTLLFDNASNILTITGDIEIRNMCISDTTLYFDLEKFVNVN